MDIISYAIGKKKGGTTPTGEIDITQNGITNVSGYATANVQVPEKQLEEKSVTISSNTTTLIEPSTGKDGMSSVSITTNIPEPSGKITITENGTDIDVSSYASADVSVPAGADLSDYFNSTFSSSSTTNPKYADLIKKFPSITIDGTSVNDLFRGTKITEIPTIINNSSITSFNNCFYECENLIEADFSNISFNSTLGISFQYMFFGCTNLTKIDLSSINTTGSVNLQGAFTNCTNLKEIDLSNLNASTRLYNTFDNCTSLEKIDISNLDLTTNVSAYTHPFDNVPTNCLILVKNQASKEWLEAKIPTFTNIQIKGA